MSRSGEESFRDALASLEDRGMRIEIAKAIKDPKQLVPAVRSAVQSGTPLVIVGGGDGSITSSVGEFVDSDCVFAVLPLGTANSFARTLEIPLDLETAVATIVDGERRRVDVGRINGHFFANAAALGLSPLIGETVPHKLKRYLGRVGYLIWAIRCVFSFRPFRLSVHDGNREERVWATEVRIFNGHFQSGVEFVEKELIDEGLIIVQAVTGKSLARLTWNWFSRFFRLPGSDADVREFRGRSLSISTRPKQKISLDGEVLTQTPATIECLHDAIEVVVPPTRPDDGP